VNRLSALFALLGLLPLPAGATATEADAPLPERRFQAVVTAVDAAKKTLSLRHKPTGFVADATWDDRSVLKARIQYDIDDVPEGWVECWAEKIDPAEKTISGIGILRSLPPDSGPPAKTNTPRERTLFRCKLLRVPLDTGKPPTAGRVPTRKGDAFYELDIHGERWTLTGKHGKHPKLSREEPLAPGELKAGLPCAEVVYREEPSGNHLVSLLGLPNQSFHPETSTNGTTGTTTTRIASEMTRLRTAYAKVAADRIAVMPVRFRIAPEVTLQNEPVTLTMEAWAKKSPNPQVELETLYLQPDNANKTTLTLDWKAGEHSGGLTRYTAELTLRDLPAGQHLVQWHCDIGGDIEAFWRSFAVIDSQTLVVMLHFTAGQPNVEFEQFHLPYDYWEESVVSLLGGPLGERKTPDTAREWITRSRDYRRRGASPNLQILQGNYAGRTGWPAPIPVQFRLEPDDVQRTVFDAAIELADMTGFDRDAIGFTAYEFGTRTVAIAHAAGVRLIGSMCIHQNWQDGSWGINHTGRPLRPYFAAKDDFRKPGNGGADGMVMVSQHDKSILWTEYGLGVFEPAWLERDWVGGGGGGRSVYDDVFMSRDFDLMDAAIQNLQNQHAPYFQSIGIEFSKSDPKDMTTRSNAGMIHYLVRRARSGNVVFCNQAAAADFYRRHYAEIPETVFYDPDYWCGLKATQSITSTWKPVAYPDLMQIENARYSAFFKKPAILPEYHWDYTLPWDYPDWGNKQLPRSVMGLLVPGEHDKFAVTPKITDTRPLKVEQELRESPDGLEVLLTLQTPGALKAFPLALWDLPREWKPGNGWWSTQGTARFLPMRAPFTGNLNGILEVDAHPGDNQYRVRITTPQRTPGSQDIAVEGMQGKVFERDGLAMAYIWPTHPWETAFELEVPAGHSVAYYAAPDGERVDLPPGKHRLVIAKECWSRITGLTQAELQAGLRPISNNHE